MFRTRVRLFHHRILYNAQSFPNPSTELPGRPGPNTQPRQSFTSSTGPVPLLWTVSSMDWPPDSEQELRSNGLELGTFLDFIQHRMAVTQSIQEPFTWIDQTPKTASLHEYSHVETPGLFHSRSETADVMLSLARRWREKHPVIQLAPIWAPLSPAGPTM